MLYTRVARPVVWWLKVQKNTATKNISKVKGVAHLGVTRP